MNPRHLPNLLTFSRLFLAVVAFWFLHVLAHAEGDASAVADNAFWAFWFYLVAVATDFLDGRIARRYGWVSAVGRVADPVVDKVLTLGGLVFLAAAGFVVEAGPFAARSADYGELVPAWAVVLILAREFLVTALRGLVESRGKAFPAEMSGKWKMTFQSIYVLIILGALGGIPEAIFLPFLSFLWHPYLLAGLFWIVILMTVYSGVTYVVRAARLLRGGTES
jgi:CDP-diacylglycerol--glycerol-3-phosphate 3-phosphatidyltransferase